MALFWSKPKSDWCQRHLWFSIQTNIHAQSKSEFQYFLSPFQELVISQNFSGHLVAHTEWPASLKNKGVFFIKREVKPLPKENFLNEMTCGDIHPNALDHFCAWVEEVISSLDRDLSY